MASGSKVTLCGGIFLFFKAVKRKVEGNDLFYSDNTRVYSSHHAIHQNLYFLKFSKLSSMIDKLCVVFAGICKEMLNFGLGYSQISS